MFTSGALWVYRDRKSAAASTASLSFRDAYNLGYKCVDSEISEYQLMYGGE